jgi:hypothetical protein
LLATAGGVAEPKAETPDAVTDSSVVAGAEFDLFPIELDGVGGHEGSDATKDFGWHAHDRVEAEVRLAEFVETPEAAVGGTHAEPAVLEAELLPSEAGVAIGAAVSDFAQGENLRVFVFRGGSSTRRAAAVKQIDLQEKMFFHDRKIEP